MVPWHSVGPLWGQVWLAKKNSGAGFVVGRFTKASTFHVLWKRRVSKYAMILNVFCLPATHRHAQDCEYAMKS